MARRSWVVRVPPSAGRKLLLAAAGLMLVLGPASARAHAPSDFTLAPGLTARLVYSGSDVGQFSSGSLSTADGGILLGGFSGSDWLLRKLGQDGTVSGVVTVVVNAGDGFTLEDDSIESDHATGAIWLKCTGPGTVQYWRIEGLPRTLGAGSCPVTPGDMAPGVLDNSTNPPTLHPTGDGVVNVSDVVALLRASVNLVQIECGP